jgi:hypothetical protein
MLKLLLSAAAGLLALAPARADDQPDLSRVDPPHKEPAYASKQPMYGVVAFGPRAEKRVWLALDRSRPDGPFDVLYIDRNADGDLTGPGERLTTGPGGDDGGRFQVGDFTDPATGARHTDFGVRVSGPGPQVMVSLRWKGTFKFGGGYPEDPEPGYMRLAARPEDAPVVWLYGDGPFRFQRWCGGRLPVGGSEDLRVFLGQPGRGRSSFGAAQEHFLPAGEFLRATLIYRDGMGKERRAVCELKERC